MSSEVSCSLSRQSVKWMALVFPYIGAVCYDEEKEGFKASHCDRSKSLTEAESKRPRKIIFICSFVENDADTQI